MGEPFYLVPWPKIILAMMGPLQFHSHVDVLFKDFLSVGAFCLLSYGFQNIHILDLNTDKIKLLGCPKLTYKDPENGRKEKRGEVNQCQAIG